MVVAGPAGEDDAAEADAAVAVCSVKEEKKVFTSGNIPNHKLNTTLLFCLSSALQYLFYTDHSSQDRILTQSVVCACIQFDVKPMTLPFL